MTEKANYRYFLLLSNFIDGKHEKPASGEFIEDDDPATQKPFAKVPDSNEEDVNAAVAAAKKAFESWSQTSIQYRSDFLMKIADEIESRLEEFAEKECKDQGKPVTKSRDIEIPRCVSDLRFLATFILHSTDEASYQKFPCDALTYTQRSPVGVAGIISPWNFPLYLLTWKIAPAIAFGNTCVVNPSDMTSITAWLLCDVMSDVGLPPGVVNMVFGRSIIAETIVQHPDVSLVSFNGSVAVGQHVRALVGPTKKKLQLELRGKGIAVVFDDADLEDCVNTTMESSYGHPGAITTRRIFVQRGIYESFLEKFVAKMRELVIGDPTKPKTTMGPLVSEQHCTEVKDCIKLATETEGVEVHSWGELDLPETHKKGNFVAPAILTGVKDDSAFMQDEIFGPVTCVAVFDTEAEAIERANNVQYSLCAAIWTSDVSRMQRVSKDIDAGTIWVNCWLAGSLCVPFKGVKLSGVGQEGQNDAYDFFTEQKTICMKTQG